MSGTWAYENDRSVRGWVGLGWVGLALTGCAAPEQPDPPKSSKCVYRSEFAPAGASLAQASIVMNNDGNFCWGNSTQTRGGVQTGSTLRIVKAPSNGEVLNMKETFRTRIGYRPKPGFTGTDEFAVSIDDVNVVRTFKVTVEK